jgi:hypothetical protein
MNTMQKIDKGIPIPADVYGDQRGAPRIYPWEEMEIGDSFIFPTAFRSSAHAIAAKASTRYGKKFKARKTADDQWRVWRIA